MKRRPVDDDPRDDDFARAMADVAPLPADTRERVRPRRAVSPTTTPAPSTATSASHANVDDAGLSDFAAHGIDRRELRRLKRGDHVPGGRLDLHGLTAAEALARAAAFVESSRHRHRVVAIVHGRGLHSEGSVAILRGRVRAWLTTHPAVLAFADAPVHDGGAGVVYVLLRK